MQIESRLTNGAFLVLGRAGLDLYPDPAGTAIEDAVRFIAGLGGSAGNIAAALAIGGARVGMIGAVSDDAVGRYTLNELTKRGIGTDHVAVIGGAPRNTLALSESRIEGHQTVIYRNNAADLSLDETMVAGVDFSAIAALVVTGTTLAADPARGAAMAAMRAAREAKALVVIDLDYRPYGWKSRQEAAEVLTRAAALADIAIGNDVEFDVMSGGSGTGRDVARDFARDGRIAIYKMGEHGSVTFQGDSAIETPVFAVKALKPVGAGDAFLGTALAALANGAPLATALTRGAASAAVVVTKPGCAIALPTPAEIDAFIQDRT
jgi:5-dehydro-2-deoxygluconokinase